MAEPGDHCGRSHDGSSSKGFTLVVRPPGRPSAVRIFTDNERADAELYAAGIGATVEPLA